MNIIIPMAGIGHRFKTAGYTDPKPLIKVSGKRIIDYVLDCFDRENDYFTFICNSHDYYNTDIFTILTDAVQHCTVYSVSNHRKGPVWTVNSADFLIRRSEPVLFSYCDSPFLWNYNDFKSYINKEDPDGCLITHAGFHPHNLTPGIMAHCKVEGDKVLQVKEKGCFTNNPIDEQASSGAYYFKTGELARKYFIKTIAEDVNYNGEYYITLSYNLMIRDGLDIRSYMCDNMISFGTPSEIENYTAWKTIIETKQCCNEKDILKCYDFWRKIHEKKV